MNSNKGPNNVDQRIDGSKHQIAGRDIVNYFREQLKPKQLDECTPNELRSERDWSRKLVDDAKRNIRSSWPIITLPFTFTTAVLVICFFWPEYFFVIALAPATLALQMYFIVQVNEMEFKVISKHKKIIDYVYERLRDFGINEK